MKAVNVVFLLYFCVTCAKCSPTLSFEHAAMQIKMCYTVHEMILVLRKPVFGVSDQVRHKSGCIATEDGYMLEISDLGSRGIVLSI